jgi:hypothetical protein
MSANIYANNDTEAASVLEPLGFRWCKKDCRWERRRELTPTEAVFIRKEFPDLPSWPISQSQQDEFDLEDE